jgi:hypothetical protein
MKQREHLIVLGSWVASTIRHGPRDNNLAIEQGTKDLSSLIVHRLLQPSHVRSSAIFLSELPPGILCNFTAAGSACGSTNKVAER